nr:MFS transporter [Rickettsiaceae bacterium]
MSTNLAVFIFGFVSGFILLISGNTLNFWLSASNVNIESIGLFSLASAPYALCFLWAPILDRFKIPFLSRIFGHRFSWIYLLQILLAISVYSLSLCSPEKNLYPLAILSFIVALIASTQDTAIGALRSQIIKASDQGAVSGTYIFGYRVGMLISGSGAILLSSFIPFSYLYKAFAFIIITFPFLIHYSTSKAKLTTIYKTEKIDFSKGILSLGSWKLILYLVIFLILYRMPDNFINVMMNPFLLAKGFKTVEIATIGKFLGTISAIFGGFLASFVMKKRSIESSLIIFGIIHGIAHIT